MRMLSLRIFFGQDEILPFERFQDRLHRCFVWERMLLGIKLQDKPFLPVGNREGKLQAPVFLRHEVLDLLLAYADQVQGGGLHASGGQAPLHLFPQQGAHGIAGHTVESAPRLLRVHEILIDRAGRSDRILHGVLRDLIKTDAAALRLRALQQRLQMPGDRFAFAVRVGCKVNF